MYLSAQVLATGKADATREAERLDRLAAGLAAKLKETRAAEKEAEKQVKALAARRPLAARKPSPRLPLASRAPNASARSGVAPLRVAQRKPPSRAVAPPLSRAPTTARSTQPPGRAPQRSLAKNWVICVFFSGEPA